ncbi:MAG TPA: OsmC family protein [Gemmatimonadales bacterium]|nr:OsmC family protein [Gemmatimonadales bacterium]
MDNAEAIKTAIERNVKAVSLRPSVGQGTAVTRARLKPGLSCEIEEGPWRFTVGMSEKYGGSSAGPNPGVYGRAALGSCLAIGYAMWAARLGVPIDALEVEVQADYDVRGELGAAKDVPPGYLAVRYLVRVESPAPEADVQRVLDVGDQHSFWLDDFTRAIPVQRQVRITAPRG